MINQSTLNLEQTCTILNKCQLKTITKERGHFTRIKMVTIRKTTNQVIIVRHSIRIAIILETKMNNISIIMDNHKITYILVSQ